MRAAIFNRAGMIDRPDRDIETGTAGTCRDRQADGDGEHERPLPNPSRPHCVPHLETEENFLAVNADIFISTSWSIIRRSTQRESTWA
jgi:hypothetical protein